MKEVTTYTCEICGGSYSHKDLALKCEESGMPKFYNEFVGKWVILPVQIMFSKDTEQASSVSSSVEFFPVRVESNSILGPAQYDALNQLKFVAVAHSLKLKTRSFFPHNIIKEFLSNSLVVSDEVSEKLSTLLVESEQARLLNKDNSEIIEQVKELTNTVAKENDFSLQKPEGIEKYEYKSNV